MIIIFSMFYLFFIFLDIVPLIKEEPPKLLYLYSVLMGAAFMISIALALQMNIPSPAAFIGQIVNFILK